MPASPTDSPAPRVTKRRAETRVRLLAAAAEVFAEQGFGRTAVEDVCERAGYTRGAFYSNFDSLDEMFFRLHSERTAEVVRVASAVVAAAVSDARTTALTAGDVMKRVVAALPITRESHLLQLEFAAHAARHPDVAAAFVEQRRDLREALQPILRMGLAAGGIDPGPVDLDDMARVVLAVQDGLYLQELLEPSNAALIGLRHQALTAAVIPTSGQRD